MKPVTSRALIKLWSKLIWMVPSFTVLKYIYLESSVILISQVEVKKEGQLKVIILSTLREEKAWEGDCLGVSWTRNYKSIGRAREHYKTHCSCDNINQLLRLTWMLFILFRQEENNLKNIVCISTLWMFHLAKPHSLAGYTLLFILHINRKTNG